ncbi:MAG: nucleotide pyrophosphohydrolase [Candidatus Shapirobacteria bacterium]
MKNIEQFQREVDEWTSQFDPQYWPPHEMMTRLMEETGELAREINHRFGNKKKKVGEKDRQLGDEMADIIFTLACLANSQGISLAEYMQRVMDKCRARDNDRFGKKK